MLYIGYILYIYTTLCNQMNTPTVFYTRQTLFDPKYNGTFKLLNDNIKCLF